MFLTSTLTASRIFVFLAGFDKSGKYDKPSYKDWVYQPATQTFVFKPNKPK
ncbi:MAG: hypothetical protein M3463_07865 [Verrucomicrobiota bacterium]|nr:hypothetical protein [Verrucomicrobiota bacterium]